MLILWGTGSRTADEEIEDYEDYYSYELKPAEIEFYRIWCISESEIKPGTDIIIFDFGGMALGNSLLDTNSRELIKYALNNPSVLIKVDSMVSWYYSIEHEMREMNILDIPNMQYQRSSLDDPIPEWFRDLHGLNVDKEIKRANLKHEN